MKVGPWTIEPLPSPDFSFQNHLWRRAAELKESIYRQILQQILGREPVPEDGKDISIALQDGRHDMELFAYKGTIVGAIIQESSYSPEAGYRFGYRFDPAITSFTTH